MEASNTNYQQVTVEVPEDRVAEFHAFFARFLAGRTRTGADTAPRPRPPLRRARRAGEQTEATGQPSEITEV